MSLFICPICSAPLERGEKTYFCANGHSYDIAAQGYTHLLPVNKKHSKLPGDDKNMASARSAFLSKGYYKKLAGALCSLAVKLTEDKKAPAVFDSGCGEGYYTSAIYRSLAGTGRSPAMAGIDISKFSLKRAARREQNVEFAVASAYHLPLADSCVDLLTNVFSPLAIDEFERVIKPGGYYIYVVPAEMHLWELKQVLYDKPYKNEEKKTPYAGFEYIDIVPVDSVMQLSCSEDIMALFGMTPYVWKTPKEGIERLERLTQLETRASFKIHVFRRK